ncbi:hypothetical protein HZB74_00275 [Candidatus Saccharibacteria bacterium]|nr:hypothetical protein [Candidatus Saccharibacteria bacterium]
MSANYSREELFELNLPGFERDATFMDVVDPTTDWQPALSLSIYGVNPDSGQLDILTAIRTEGTETHPMVISTPTGRFPKQFEGALIADKKDLVTEAPEFRIDEIDPTQNLTIATFDAKSEPIPDRNRILPYLTHEVLARKLGLGQHLQKTNDSEPIATVSLSEMIAGFSYCRDDKETGEPRWEPLVMYAAAILVKNRAIIPRETKAYREIGWTKIDDFLVGHAQRKAKELVPTIDPQDEVGVCVRGLCLASSGSITRKPSIFTHLGIQEGPLVLARS